MKKILIRYDSLVIAVGSNMKIVENGILVDDFVYGLAVGEDEQFVEPVPAIVEVANVPMDFAPYKYFYSDSTFVLNSDYVESKTLEQIVEELKVDNDMLKLIVADLGLMVGGGL